MMDLLNWVWALPDRPDLYWMGDLFVFTSVGLIIVVMLKDIWQSRSRKNELERSEDTETLDRNTTPHSPLLEREFTSFAECLADAGDDSPLHPLLLLGIELERQEHQLTMESRHRFHVLTSDFHLLLESFLELSDEARVSMVSDFLNSIEAIASKLEELLNVLNAHKQETYEKRSMLAKMR